MIVAPDTSALGKLLLEEDESGALRDRLAARSGAGDTFCTSTLAVAELRRLALRLGVAQDRVQAVVQPFTVVRLTEAVLHLAGHLPHPHLRTLDAIHTASAVSVEAGALVTYDSRQAEAAQLEGLRIDDPASPGEWRTGGTGQPMRSMSSGSRSGRPSGSMA